MKIWLITIGEPLPFKGDDVRLFRTGNLAFFLSENQHDVVWWTSAFNHFKKKFHVDTDCTKQLDEHLTIQFLKGRGYSKNIGLQRIKDHLQLAKKFTSISASYSKPDIIICSFPTLGLCEAAIAYGRSHDVPVLIDIRDLWPDVFLDLLPKTLMPIGKIALHNFSRRTARMLRNADGLISITRPMLDWGLRLAQRQQLPCDKVVAMGYNLATRKGIRPYIVGKGAIKLCFAGSLGHQFDLQTVIRAVNEVNRTDVVELHIAGSGASESELRTLSKNAPNIFFHGFLEKESLHKLLSRCDMGIAPYNNTRNFRDNLPNKIYEYMAWGLPILCGVEGFMKVFILDSKIGKGYPPGDHVFLRDLITELFENKQIIATQSQQAIKLFKAKYTTEILFREYQSHMLKVVNTRHS